MTRKSTKSQSRSQRRLAAAKVDLDNLLKERGSLIERSGKVPGMLRLEIERAQAKVQAAELHDRFGHKAGTPQTHERLDDGEGSGAGGLARMYANGQLSDDQYTAAAQIASVIEAIERAVSVRSVSFEARVDNSGASGDILVESLGRIRVEALYSEWRSRLKVPRRMIVDMLTDTRSLVDTAAAHGVPWRKARERLMRALDDWADLRAARYDLIDEGDVLAIYARLGCGVLLPPRPRPSETTSMAA